MKNLEHKKVVSKRIRKKREVNSSKDIIEKEKGISRGDQYFFKQRIYTESKDSNRNSVAYLKLNNDGLLRP